MLSTKKSYVDMLVDSTVIACVALFSTFGAVNSSEFWLIALKSFGLSFFVQLAVERGLKKGDS